MRKAVGFRNVLVHDYIEVDDSIVVDRLKSLGDLEEFVRQVAAYVTVRSPSLNRRVGHACAGSRQAGVIGGCPALDHDLAAAN